MPQPVDLLEVLRAEVTPAQAVVSNPLRKAGPRLERRPQAEQQAAWEVGCGKAALLT